VEQGDCGSCYSIAETYALQSRFNILLAKAGIVTAAVKNSARDENIASISYKTCLACSYYNQHCEGGYPELVSKTAYDFGITGTNCEGKADSSLLQFEAAHGVKGESKVCPSECYKDPERYLWYAKNYGYVGGFYGKCSEARIMNEILHHGPVPIAIEVGGNFDVKI